MFARSRNRFSAHVVAVLLLCIPAALNGSPLLFSDSRSYYVGGRMAIERAEQIALRVVCTPSGQTADVAGSPTHAKAVRSIFYSVLSYLLASNLSLWSVILVQAG